MNPALLLDVDMTTGTVSRRHIEPEIRRRYIGGSGLGAWILNTELPKEIDPLGPFNLLLFLTGPFAGTRAPCSGRTSVISKSPLTGIWGESDVGGRFGEYLKSLGVDGLIIRGRAETPSVLRLAEEDAPGETGIPEARILDGSGLWGLDTYATHERLVAGEEGRVSTMSIGRAGERLVLLSGIVSDGPDARIAARGGLGAVMGSKNLKAVAAVRGSVPAEVHDPDGLASEVKAAVKDIAEVSGDMRSYGTASGVELCHELEDFPLNNWRDRRWDRVENLSGTNLAETALTGRYHCARCPIGCGRVVRVESGEYRTDTEAGGPEYETMGSLGGNLLVSDLEAVVKANDLCNRYGIDTISVGQVLGLLFEAYERGYIDAGLLERKAGSVPGAGDTAEAGEPPRPEWGSGRALVYYTRLIGEGEGIGRILGLGIRLALMELDIDDPELDIQVKGMELPSHDPRAFVTVALGYATSPRGACHLQAFSHGMEAWSAIPDLGFAETLDRYSLEGKAELTKGMQDLMCVFDSLKTCKFLLSSGVSPSRILGWLNAITGWDMTLDELLAAGAGIFELKRRFNVREGVASADDTLPARVATGPGGENLEKLLEEYYALRGWSDEGVPPDRPDR